MDLFIRACEGGFYLTELQIDGVSDEAMSLICQEQGIDYQLNQKFHSLQSIKEHFSALAPSDIWLCHSVTHDEMIGLPSAAQGEFPGANCERLKWYSDTGAA